MTDYEAVKIPLDPTPRKNACSACTRARHASPTTPHWRT